MQPLVRQSVPTFLDISRFSSLLFFASSLRKNTSVWYGAAIRGDVNKVVIGENTNIGDRSVVHVAKIQGDYPTFIGDNVTVGPGAIIHAATIRPAALAHMIRQANRCSIVHQWGWRSAN